MTPTQRKVTYSAVIAVLAAVIALAVTYGVLDETTGPLWMTLGTAIVGLAGAVLARGNVSDDDKGGQKE